MGKGEEEGRGVEGAMSTISDYKENAGQDRTSQLWEMTRSPTSGEEMGLEDQGKGRGGLRFKGSMASSPQASNLTCPGM